MLVADESFENHEYVLHYELVYQLHLYLLRQQDNIHIVIDKPLHSIVSPVIIEVLFNPKLKRLRQGLIVGKSLQADYPMV